MKIKKSQLEYYEITWDRWENKTYLCVKVVRILRNKKGKTNKTKYKNMITLPSIDLTNPAKTQLQQHKLARSTWNELKKVVDQVLKKIPKGKVEF